MSKKNEPKSSHYPSKNKSFRLPSFPSIKGINPKSIIERIITIIQIGKSGGAGDPINMSDSGKAAGLTRPMKFPYTLGAKIGQFPYKFMMNSVWPFKYYLIALGVCLPVFYKLGKQSHHPNNVRNWEQIRKNLFTPGHH